MQIIFLIKQILSLLIYLSTYKEEITFLKEEW